MKTAAQEIRKLLKETFKTKFQVRKRGHNCVDVNWQNGPTRDEVNTLICKFKMGRFDGMTDSYEYSNRREDIPQVQYLFLNREITKEIYETSFNLTKNFYNCFKFCEKLEDRIVNGTGYFHNVREYLSYLIQKINLEKDLSLETFKSLS